MRKKESQNRRKDEAARKNQLRNAISRSTGACTRESKVRWRSNFLQLI
jgi:hypothetical protein